MNKNEKIKNMNQNYQNFKVLIFLKIINISMFFEFFKIFAEILNFT